ncbi:hypothetical protein ABID95_004217 [Streptomyces atratus]|uniref:hypothetical protein n=1 Tax=Streptomyces TaxID=1883 RepID=UPI000E302BF6|nr:hypothetical protein [Streptomyces sp. AcE210]RFC78201.1 hypothetical protein DXZ75_10830 [Streptomyces sp. AcE210]
MGRRPRDRGRDAAAIRAAAERLLAGTPLRSASGKLTATELIVESGLRRDVVYPHHQDLLDEFRLRAKAQGRVPTAAQELAERYAVVVEELKETKQQLAAERQLTAFLRRTVVELSVEVENVRRDQEDALDATVVPMARRRGPGRRFPSAGSGS